MSYHAHIHLYAAGSAHVVGRTVYVIQFCLRRKSATYQVIYISWQDKSFLRVLSLQTMILLSFCDLVFLSMKEIKRCLIETTMLSTSSVSGLWKPGCPWVASTDTLPAGYLHLHISMNKWSVSADLWCYFCMFLVLCFILLPKHFPSVLLSLSFYMCVCVFVQIFLPCCYFILLIIQTYQTASCWINPSLFVWGW